MNCDNKTELASVPNTTASASMDLPFRAGSCFSRGADTPGKRVLDPSHGRLRTVGSSLGEPVCASYVLESTKPKGQRFQQPPKVRVSLEGHYLTVPFCQHEIKIIIKTHPADWR